MSGDVSATIHGYVKEYGIYVALFLAFVGAYVTWVRKGMTWTFALTRTRKLKRLQERRARLKRLHDCNREYYGYLLTGVLWVLLLLGLQLGLEGFTSLRPTWTVEQVYVQGVAHAIERFAMGLTVYVIALSHVVEDRILRRHFDRNMARLDGAIARLDAKQAQHQRPAAA